VDRLLRLKHRALAAARRRVVRSDWLNRHLPWVLWCAVGAADSLTVAWVVARRAGRPLTFVQIGSNDGVIHDPLHSVVRACGWSGVLVEPLPGMFERLVANYDGVPGLVFENAAVGTVDGTSTLYSVDPRPGDPYWVDQIASFDRATIRSHADVIAGVEERIVEVPVASLTLPTLVSRHGLASIDVLHIDVEGYDFEVLKQIEFSSSWAPTFIIYEREHFDRQTDRAARRMLRAAGYRCIDIWPDQFAFRATPERGKGTHGRRRPSRRAAQRATASRSCR
jgi:FkbM family methyltransferase